MLEGWEEPKGPEEIFMPMPVHACIVAQVEGAKCRKDAFRVVLRVGEELHEAGEEVERDREVGQGGEIGLED